MVRVGDLFDDNLHRRAYMPGSSSYEPEAIRVPTANSICRFFRLHTFRRLSVGTPLANIGHALVETDPAFANRLFGVSRVRPQADPYRDPALHVDDCTCVVFGTAFPFLFRLSAVHVRARSLGLVEKLLP
jgi:hypothetical protein